MLRPWTQLPAARDLLASCTRRAPRSTFRHKQFPLSKDEWLEYDQRDPRVAELEAIRDDWNERVWRHLLANVEANGGREYLLSINPDVDEAIDQARRDADAAEYGAAA